MLQPMRLCRILWLLPVVLLWACEEPHPSGAESQLIEIKKQLTATEAQNRILAADCHRWQETAAQFEADFENLKAKNEDLARWSRQLAGRFGPGLWYVDVDERPLPIKSIPQATPSSLIGELNKLFRRDDMPLVTLDKIDGDTAHVRIDDEAQLTQAMGSTGATAYLQAITYTLTSLNSLNFVDFHFKEGDHAIPGRYTR
jgi:hypothetical protein